MPDLAYIALIIFPFLIILNYLFFKINYSIASIIISSLVIIFWLINLEFMVKQLEFFLRYVAVYIFITHFLNSPTQSYEVSRLKNVVIIWVLIILFFLWVFGLRFNNKIDIFLLAIFVIITIVFFIRKVPKVRKSLAVLGTFLYLSLTIFYGEIELSNYFENRTIKEIDKKNILIIKESYTFTNSYLVCKTALKIFRGNLYFVKESGVLNGKIESVEIEKKHNKVNIRIRESQQKITLKY